MPVASPFYLLIGGGSIGVYVMPVASPFCLLIGGRLIGTYVMPVASKRILPFISTERIRKSVFCVEINKFPHLPLLA
ncbi:hypothetical protein ADQ36_07520 [Salmonella enterica subsp. salamae]|nr:hypothetical protein [Salmonella enterica]EBI0475891.1 hypothetical protein [Salmonella enterica subsp. enterica serovar Braenderup]EBQ4851966.1 hypothetical protein [Salmonella enterica subsp. salamae]EEJ4442607.1 hypothetical protein [Salmonella enterica subsp. salamae serovar 50:b:z6]HAE4962895.1 hypothetical protein [Salmonella enterica subsp. salamae serovar 18:z10:z6]HAE8611286.1 hypothetical protein [Salmonella enterica subsp. salamae serovar 30:1,z28:z6]